jgi:two-component system, sensor histidine kinase RpfC
LNRALARHVTGHTASPSSHNPRIIDIHQEERDEYEQARVRVILGFIAFTACHLIGAPNFWPVTAAFATYTIGVFVWIRARPHVTPARRVIAITGDVATCAFALYIGGEKTMWVYMILHFIMVGNSCRFAGFYFWFNESLSVLAFAIIIIVTPAWNAHPYLAGGLFIALITNPIYAHLFVGRFRRRDREHERVTVQHGADTQARSRFVASISHDIRTSLTGMKGAAEILMRLATDDVQRRTLTVFNTSYHTLDTLLQDLLDLSRLEASKLTLEPARFDIHETLRDVELLFMQRARDKGVEFRVTTSPAVGPFLIGDAPKIARILMNIIGNAIKFTQQGHVALKVSLAEQSGVVRFEVEDTGPGIAADVQPLIFEPFTQADASTTRKYAGSGLGLSIVRHLADIMNGRIGFKSDLGSGSTFWVELALTTDEAPDTNPLTITGAISVYDGCPRDMLRQLADAGVAIVDHTQAASFQRLSPQVPFLARIVHTPYASISPGLPTADAQRPPLVLVYDESLRMPHTTRDFIAMPMVARWWTNAVRLEALRRGAHFEPAIARNPPEPNRPRGARILCVDDTVSLLWVTEQLLSFEGYDVVTATNGKLALELLLADPTIALAIVDYHMPEMDGMELIGRYRKTSAQAARLPMIMLTASVSHETEAAALEGGATVFMLKPYRADEFLHAVAVQLAMAHSAATSQAPTATAMAASLSAPGATPIVMNRLRDLRKANPDPKFVRRMVELFTQHDAPDVHESLSNATTAGAQRSLLHALAGSSANVGAAALSQMCRDTMSLTDETLTSTKAEWSAQLYLATQSVITALVIAVDELESAAVQV